MKNFLAISLLSVTCSVSASTCDWNGGQNPFKGSPKYAVLAYEDIPMWPRLLLAVRVGKAPPTDRIKIFKDRIESESGESYQPGVFAMNFGNGHRCDTVRMDHWPVDKYEPAPVWCVGWEGMTWCVAMPTVCNNVSLVFRDRSGGEVSVPTIRSVPEPGAIYLTLAAIGAAILAKRKKNVGRDHRGSPSRTR